MDMNKSWAEGDRVEARHLTTRSNVFFFLFFFFFFFLFLFFF